MPAPADLALDTVGRELIVTWDRGSGSGGEVVRLAAGTGPDPAGHELVADVPVGAGRAAFALPDAGPARTFVSVSSGDGGHPVVLADRHIGFDGPANFRDIGGYAAADGRTVRWGLAFRSDTLNLSDADLQRFEGLGIRTVYDLRNEVERTATPDRLPEHRSLEVHHLPLISDDPADNPMDELRSAGPGEFLRLLYLHILERSAPAIGRILTGLGAADELPAVFHCSAGKDRTGLVSGILLSVLGVPLEVVVDDYELTGRYRTTEHVQASVERIGRTQNLPSEVVAGMLQAPRSAMESALHETATRYGGFDRYLTGPAGTAGDLPDRLRTVLLGD